MAEALARHFHGDRLLPCSAGINPLGHITRETLQVLAEWRVSLEGLRSKGLAEIDWADCALVVNLSEYSLAGLLPLACAPRVMHRPVTDPYGRGLEVYRQTRDAICRLLAQEITGGS